MRVVVAPVILVFDACVSSHPPWALSWETVRAQQSIYEKERRGKETWSTNNKEVMWARTQSTQDIWALEAIALDYGYGM